MNQLTQSVRSDGIQALRAVACLLVLIQHAGFFAAFAAGRDYHPYLAINFGRVGVSLFFSISGFVMGGCMDEGRSFILRRIARIYPPFWMAIALSFPIMTLAMTGWQFDLLSVTLAPVSAVNSTYGIPYWTLCYEVAFYVVVYLLILGRAGRNSVLAMCMLWVLAIVVADAYHPFGFVDDDRSFALIAQPGNLILVTPYPLFFIGGLSASMLKEDVHNRAKPIHLIVAAVALYAFSSGLRLTSTVPLFIVQASAFACLTIAVSDTKFPALIGWFGDISYGTYLMHLPIIISVAYILHARFSHIRLSVAWISLFLAGAIGGMVFGYLEFQFHRRVIRPLFRRRRLVNAL